MPNIKSAKKRVLVNGKKTEQNKAFRSEMKTAIKKVELLVKENNAEEAKVALAAAFKIIDSAETKNIIHKNNAANKKAKLAKKVASIAVEEAPVVTEEPAKEEAPVVTEEVATPAPKKRGRPAKKVEAAE